MTATEDEQNNILRRYVEHGEGTPEELRQEASSQVKKLEARISIPMQDAVAAKLEMIRQSRSMPIAEESEKTDSAVYDVEVDVVRSRMGERIKMSCNVWKDEGQPCTLSEAEEAMLELYASRADIGDDLDVLDLGCGYGTVAFFLAQRFPKSRFVASTMSSRQVEYVEQEAQRLGLTNVKAVRGDINTQDFAPESFDRIVAVELLEYFTNLDRFFAKISKWLKPGGLFFTQFATSKLYCFEATELAAAFTGESSFVSADYLIYAARGFKIQQQWWVSGTHCARSFDAWLKLGQENKAKVSALQAKTMSAAEVETEHRRFEWYLITLSELFRHNNGDFIGTTHYLFEKDNLSVE